ncbi:uncharacterized protein LOC132200942 isoform X2 [Neocloeon triangulifer]|uniref:uncharacterized protein LOC132200942 isoform X2 n=1 Tax=Neocloeon triangulifer TaxID=2078957 RepID=UPI00286F5846|nr:uncharacterized protein LOC132200942 isoform X2 [Neocloeon triangulifer]
MENMGLQIRVVAVLTVLASHAWCAPQSALHPVHPGHRLSEPSAQYMALLSDLDHPPATAPGLDYGGGYGDEEDTFAGVNLYPLPHGLMVKQVTDDFATTYVPLVHSSVAASQHPFKIDSPAPHDQVVVMTDQSNPPAPTRFGKSVDESSAAATLVPMMPIQYKNRNPFINEEMQNSRNVPVVVPIAVLSTESPTSEATAASTSETPHMEDKVAVVLPSEVASEAPDHEEEEEAKSAPETNESTPRAAPTASTEEEVHLQTEEVKATMPTEETVVYSGGSHPIPPWIPDKKQEDLDSEEEEREIEQIDRITNALVEEETAEEGEAITKGRMQPDEGLGTPSIIAIVIGFVGIIGITGAAAGFLLYKRSLQNKPQTLNDKISNPDYSSYIDDTLRDNSEEMYSLDNDSFLNSLEAMTIQNYWTENVKHTKL